MRKKTQADTGGNVGILENESASTRLHSVENSIWKRLWTWHETESME